MQDKLDKAENFYLKEIDILKKISESDFEMLSTAANNLAGIYMIQHRYDEAEILYKQCIDITEGKSGKNSYDLVDFLDNLIFLYENQGKFVEADSACNRSLAIYRANFPDGHQLIKNAQDNCNRVKLKL
jgi:tetratricopeptide (TPR) repeat protein